ELFGYLTQHWLRLVEDTGAANRSQLPTHLTRVQLHEQCARMATPAPPFPLDEDKRRVVRGARYSGKNRLVRRLALGVVKSLEVEDASPTSAALLALCQWVEQVAHGEKRRLAARCAAQQERLGYVPRWVLRGMGARWQRLGALEHRVQMLLGVFAAKGVLP